jgi:hypothetical protein
MQPTSSSSLEDARRDHFSKGTCALQQVLVFMCILLILVDDLLIIICFAKAVLIRGRTEG